MIALDITTEPARKSFHSSFGGWDGAPLVVAAMATLVFVGIYAVDILISPEAEEAESGRRRSRGLG